MYRSREERLRKQKAYYYKMRKDPQNVLQSRIRSRMNMRRKRALGLVPRTPNPPVAQIKKRAQWALQQAVKRGTEKRGLCEVCGSPKTEAHHDDYSKQRQVRWFCRKHHTELHVKMREDELLGRSGA